MKSFSFSLVLGLVLAAAAVPAVAEPLPRQKAAVAEVLAGDTLRLKGGEVLRYVGLKAPPRQSKIPLVREYGEAALQFHRDLVGKGPVWVEWDLQIRNDRNELLAYVFLEDGTFVNLELLKAGHGKVQYVPPNLRYQGSLRRAELEARRERRGLWEDEPENPFIQDEYVGEKSTRIFYFPTSPELARIPKAHLVTFRSRVEAVAAGYKPCKTCREEDRATF